jgi:hypothetical protein
MSVRYHVLIADDLIKGRRRRWFPRRYYPRPPSSLRFIKREGPGPQPRVHWWLIEDDDAGPELDGKCVELWFERGPDGTDRISNRMVL